MDQREFSLIIDCCSHFLIEKTPQKMRPVIQVYAKGKLLISLYHYFAENLPDVNAVYQPHRSFIRIKQIANVKPFLSHIAPFIFYQKEALDILNEFIKHRLEGDSLRKRYDAKDDDFLKKIRETNPVSVIKHPTINRS